MKILVTNWQDRLNPRAGGAETHLHEVFGRIAAGGDEVTLLVSGFAGAPARAQLDGMEVHRTGSRHTFPLLCHRYYRRHLADRGFDVVVEDLNKIPLFAPLWARAPAVLLVHHLFGATAFREASPPVAAATWLIERPIARVYRGVPAQAVSESTAHDLVARGLRRDDITVIHNGVELDFFTPDPLGQRAPEPTFVFVGRLKRYKQVDVAIRAVARLRAEGVPARLVIAGRGSDEARLRRLAGALRLGGAVRFAGFVTEEEKRTLLRGAWAAVLPSSKEGWGITNIEAAACGTPAVARDAPGLRESVVDGRTGLLVRGGDEAWVAALGALARAPERVARIGAEARRFAERFSWERAARLTREHLAAAAVAPDPRAARRVAPRTSEPVHRAAP